MRLLLFGTFSLLFILGVPIPFALLGASAVYLWAAGVEPAVAALRMVNSLDSFVLLAVPLFLLAAQIMNEAGLTARVYRVASLLVGHRRGGLAHVNVVSSILFAGMTGSAIAEASGLGLISIKAMTDAGYDRRFSAAVTSTASTIGPIIPPSIPLVIYAVVAGTSIEALFLGGVIPGLAMGLGTMLIIALLARKRGYGAAEWPGWPALAAATREAAPALLTPVILLGGMYSGFFTATEAAAVAVVYSLLIGGVLYRSLSFAQLGRMVRETAVTTSYLMLIISTASVFGWILAIERIPQDLAAWLTGVTQEPWQLLLILNVVFLLLGCVMDTNSILVIFLPVVLPAAQALGLDMVHLGVVLVLNLMIGLNTPPFGMLLFLTSGIARVPLGELIRETRPFLAMLIVVLLLVTYFPQMVLWLPSLFK
ncbi:MAG: TRAP transporter large permease [Armatimonadota bacterium]